MGFIEFNEKLVSRLKIGFAGFETIAVGFCKCTANVIVVQFFNKFLTARDFYDHQTFKWMNSFKFRVSLLVKHWTYQTLNECINAAVSVVILLIEKCKSSFNIQHANVVDVKFFVKFFCHKRKG